MVCLKKRIFEIQCNATIFFYCLQHHSIRFMMVLCHCSQWWSWCCVSHSICWWSCCTMPLAYLLPWAQHWSSLKSHPPALNAAATAPPTAEEEQSHQGTSSCSTIITIGIAAAFASVSSCCTSRCLQFFRMQHWVVRGCCTLHFCRSLV